MGSWLALFLIAGLCWQQPGGSHSTGNSGSFGIPLGFLVLASMVFVEIRAMVETRPPPTGTSTGSFQGVYCYTSFGLFFGAAVWLRHKPVLAQAPTVFAMFVALQAVEQRMSWLPHSAVNCCVGFCVCRRLPLRAPDCLRLDLTATHASCDGHRRGRASLGPGCGFACLGHCRVASTGSAFGTVGRRALLIRPNAVTPPPRRRCTDDAASAAVGVFLRTDAQHEGGVTAGLPQTL